jgi:hypothetical protein
MKFKDECPLATPEATEQKLLEIVNAIEADHAGRLSVAVINTQFRDAGGSPEEYRAAVTAAVAHGSSGCRRDSGIAAGAVWGWGLSDSDHRGNRILRAGRRAACPSADV